MHTPKWTEEEEAELASLREAYGDSPLYSFYLQKLLESHQEKTKNIINNTNYDTLTK
jgi:hypothetical protein